jgi:hypothetical protein
MKYPREGYVGLINHCKIHYQIHHCMYICKRGSDFRQGKRGYDFIDYNTTVTETMAIVCDIVNMNLRKLFLKSIFNVHR